MSQTSLTIAKNPELRPAEDYYRLRREGIGFIEQMGSRLWTDYNESDSGITIHEALCHAITDLGYRTGWDIRDILAPASPSPDKSRPFPNQSFFTAREILTVNPWTQEDFRRLLIDLDTVRNAWIFCKQCSCDTSYYAWCEPAGLMLSYQPPEKAGLEPKEVWPLGLYEALLELEADPDTGDLNDRKVEAAITLQDSSGTHPLTMELRFQEIALSDLEHWSLFLESDDAFAGVNGQSFQLKLTRFSATKSYDLLSDPGLDEEGRNSYLRKHWRNVFYLSLEVELVPSGKKIVLENAALRLFGTAGSRSAVTLQRLKALLEDKGANGLIRRYRKKEQQKAAAVANAKTALFSHRNLDEDFCRVKVINIEEIAVCADIEVAPDADIERVQARIWFEIEQYLNPPVPFYSLQELLDQGYPVEEIFNGPELASGFLKNEDLQRATLKSVLCVSDLINRLMDIEGVIAVNQLQMTKYDAEGQVVKGAADPTWSSEGKPIFDAGKTSAYWLLYLSPQHQPRLYFNASRFLFYKNGLPFLPRMDEALDTLTQLRGEAERSKIRSAPNDLPVPAGEYRNPAQYFPVQYSFPLTYGIGPDELPSHALAERRAQAKQLKAYLMVFEQILGNALTQLAHAADLFSLDPGIERTYFVTEFTDAIIQGYSELVSGLSKTALEAMVETEPEFYIRRNRFLDHLMARFGEQYEEYGLLLAKLHGQQAAADRLIDDKISFISAYPLISHDRGKAFNHLLAPCTWHNQPGIKKRISLLLGYPDLSFHWQAVAKADGTELQETLDLRDRHAAVWFAAEPNGAVAPLVTAFLQALTPAVPPEKYRVKYTAGAFQVQPLDAGGNPLQEFIVAPAAGAESDALRDGLEGAFRELLVQMVQPEAYSILEASGKFRLLVEDNWGVVQGRSPELLDKKQAERLREELLAWSANERMIVVEHLLLRPKFPGDALYPACTDGACITCGAEDPYSFRLSLVMPGWTAPFNTDLEMRGFADRAIRQEIPSHLVGKICWVGNYGFIEDLCDPVVSEMAQLLASKGRTAGGEHPTETEACDCAAGVYTEFSRVFQEWYQGKFRQHIHPDALKMELAVEFDAKVKTETIACAAVLEWGLWSEILAVMVEHFRQVVLYGWQFERFEIAWCKWLELNATFDWTEERLQERVEAILALNLVSATDSRSSQNYRLCRCAGAILNDYGMEFYLWMDGLFRSGSFDAEAPLPTFPVQLATPCPGLTFKGGTVEKIRTLLEERYHAYREVSYRLWVVVNLLSGLSNSYPAATLHDCDEGNDTNPVRLGTTALGS